MTNKNNNDQHITLKDIYQLIHSQSQQIDQLIDRIDTLESLLSSQRTNHGPPKMDPQLNQTNAKASIKQTIERVAKHFNLTPKETALYTRYRHEDCSFNIIELFHKPSTNEDGEEFYKIKLRQGVDTLWTDVDTKVELIPYEPVTSHVDPDQASKRVWHVPTESTSNDAVMHQLYSDLSEIITHLHPELN